MSQRRVLVTGGAGFIGSHLVDHLVRSGHRVRVLDNLNPQIHGEQRHLPRYFHPGADFVFGDVRDEEATLYALHDVEVIFHLAAETGVGQSMYEVGHYTDTNVTGTARLWKAIKVAGGVRKVVLASSRAVYGEGTYECLRCGRIRPTLRKGGDLAEGRWQPRCPYCEGALRPVATSEDDDPRPTSVYGITKLVQEQLSLTLGRSYGVPTVALRFFNVYGSRQALSNPYTGILATFVTRLRAGKPLLIYEDGEQLRDFVHVQDVVRACEGAMAYRGEGHEVFNVGSGTATTISSLARTMGTLVRGDGDRGSPGLEVTGHYRVGDIRDCFADTARARSELGYAPSIRLEEGLREFLEWAEEQPLQDHTDEAARELNAAGMLRKARDAVVDARLSWG